MGRLDDCTPSDLREMRMETTRGLPDRCDIAEPPDADVSHQGEDVVATYPDDWTLVYTDEPCRLSVARDQSREGITGNRNTAVVEYILTLQAGKSVKSSYRIRITTLSNRDFEVIAEEAGSDEVSRRVRVKEVL